MGTGLSRLQKPESTFYTKSAEMAGYIVVTKNHIPLAITTLSHTPFTDLPISSLTETTYKVLNTTPPSQS